jgi:hypothetical protein
MRAFTCSAPIAAFITLVVIAPTVQAQESDQQKPLRTDGLSVANPGAQFIYATGKEAFVSSTSGEITCIGGEPTGSPFPFCTPGTQRVLIRGSVQSFRYVDLAGPASPLFAGTARYVFNCNWDQNYAGPCWGTFEWPVPGKGSREGTFTGNIDYLNFVVTGSVVGHGVGGELDGLQMKYEIPYPGKDASHPFGSPGIAIFRVLTKPQ